MLEHRRRQLSTIRHRSIRLALCAMSPSTDRIRARCSSSLRELRNMDTRRYREPGKWWRKVFLVGAAIVVMDTRAAAQQAQEPEGIEQGNYNIKQSVEFGYRFANTNGS